MAMNDIDLSLLGQQQPNWRMGTRIGNAARGLLGDRDLALALLANSRGPNAQSFGQAFGTSAIQADQMKQGREDDAFKRQYMMAQMQAMGGGNQQPNSVREYEYAKQNGYPGTFQEWTVAGGQSSRPSSVQEWEFYSKLPKDQQQIYLEMKRNPNFQVKDVNQVPTVVAPSYVAGTQQTPLSTLPQTTAAAEAVKQAEGRGGAVGKAEGEITGGIKTKGSDAKQMLNAISMAGGLLDKSTGSWVGSVIDRGAAAVGQSTSGAQAAGSLKVLQASLLSFVPKMSGPQSDADREIYIAAIGQIGDETVPRETRKAALSTVADMQQKYMSQAGLSAPASQTSRQPTLDEIRAKYGRK